MGVITRSRAKSQPNLPSFIPQPPIFATVSNVNLEEVREDKRREMEPVLTEKKDKEEITSDKWLDMFNKLNTTLLTLQSDIQDLKGLKGKVEHFTNEWKESVDKDLTDFESKQDKQEFKIKLLTNIVINQEEKIKLLENKLTMAYEREIKPNVVVSGVDEEKD